MQKELLLADFAIFIFLPVKNSLQPYKTMYILKVHMQMCLEIKDSIVIKCHKDIFGALKAWFWHMKNTGV